MIPSIGFIALVMAMGATFVQGFTPFCKKRTISFAGFSFIILVLMLVSFGCLVYCYAVSDFSVLNVYNNSNSHKPFIYKISGAWGNHEGSMLLLALILSLYNFAFAKLSGLAQQIKADIIAVQSFVSLGFLAFIIFTSNPFERIFPAPDNGAGLNPLLQDIGLAMHPPVLYVGYIGFSLGLAYSVTALIRGKADSKWASSLKRWTLFSWSFLTFGIGLGSWWAYRELGWGGFWFWDPVENASLMPWLSATAFLHSLIVMEKRSALKVWTVLLGVFTFSLSLIGIFLVRSGVLTSVHSFASDPTRGTYILMFLALVISLSLFLFATRAHKLKSNNDFMPLSKEGGILINNLLLVTACATVLLGTIYPIIMEVFNNYSVAVGAPYFNATFSPIALPLLVLAGIAPALKWKKDTLKSLRPRLYVPFVVALFVAGFVAFVPETKSFVAVVALGFSAWLIAAMASALYERRNSSITMPFLGMVTSHIGAAILCIGVTVVNIWGIEKEEIIHIDQSIYISGYNVQLKKMFISAGDNYLTRVGEFYVSNYNGDEITTLWPEVRYYPVEQSNTTESDLYYSLLSNLYIAMGDSNESGGYVVRVYYKPFVNLIWLGCVLMTLGGFIALARSKK